MIEKYICSDGDTDKCSVLIDLGTKDYKKAEQKAEEIVNDLLNAISYTTRNMKGSPNFKKSIKKIEKTLWKILK